MRFILIITTLHRTLELQRFLRSACDQTYKNFEIIIVDQNDDDRVAGIVDEFGEALTIRHVRSSRRGASSGRNIGLNCRWEADIVAFPDDDCWFPPDLLARVAEFFRIYSDWQGLTGRSVTGEGLPSNGRWHTESGQVTLANAWNRATCFSMFFRSSVVRDASFDETLGCGANTLWGGGEDLDFLLQVITSGHRVFFDPSLTVFHPEWSTSGETNSVREKALSYARGMGRVLRKHHYPLHLVGYQMIRPFGGALLCLTKGNTWGASYHWVVLKGRMHGWIAPVQPETTRSAHETASVRAASHPALTPQVPAHAVKATEAIQHSRSGGASL